MKDIKRINKVLEIENKIAVSLILNSAHPRGKHPADWHQNKLVHNAVDAIQYIIDCNAEDSSSTNRASEALSNDDRILSHKKNLHHPDKIKRLQSEVYDSVFKHIDKENDPDSSNSAASSGAKRMTNKYNMPRMGEELLLEDMVIDKDNYYSPNEGNQMLNIIKRHKNRSGERYCQDRRKSPLKTVSKLSVPHLDFGQESSDEDRHYQHRLVQQDSRDNMFYPESPPEKEGGHMYHYD